MNISIRRTRGDLIELSIEPTDGVFLTESEAQEVANDMFAAVIELMGCGSHCETVDAVRVLSMNAGLIEEGE